MKKDFPVQLFKGIKLFLFTIAIVAFCLPIKAKANELEHTKSYQIILRAGEHGNFDITPSESPNIYNAKKLAFNVAPDTSLSVQVKSGEIIINNEYLCDIKIDPNYVGKYFVIDYENKYNNISKNQEYVIDYGRLVDAAEYKVEYIDNATGIQIIEPKLKYGNDGNQVSASPEIISNYAFVSSSSQPITLVKGEVKTITFRYNSTLTGGTTTNTTYQSADGGTETINETQQNPIYQTIPGTAPVAAVAATGGATDTTAIEDEETALEAEPIQQEEEIQEKPESTDEIGETTEEATIEEEEVPLAAGQKPVNIAAVLAILLGGVALILAVVWIVVRRRIVDVEGIDPSDDEYKE